ncbi:the catalytic subunit of protein kinase Ck2 [Powellomyces hirtus]|nr:the catalytic subunit of protein kinase Ck2 [Powellomyces hirtus]
MHNDSHTCQSAVHANVNEKMPREFFDWETSKVTWCDGSLYRRTQVLGRGKYSNVYAVVRKTDGREYAVKSLKPRRAKKFKREILILRNLRAGPNIIALIFRKIDNTDWKELYPTLNCEDIRFYSFQLLRALDFAHSKGIMHRDVKPQNVVIDHKARELRLIDWGLADFYFPGAEYSLRVASRFYKPPEILLGNRRYDYSFDMWGTGCLLAAMIFSVEVMFRGDSEEDQLRAISSVLGGADLRAYARDYQIELTPEIIEVVGESRTKRIDLQSFGSRCTSTVGEREAIDVIEKLLRYDPCERLTARQALHHPYYSEHQTIGVY